MTGPTDVRIVEVGPRDGLQNEPRIVPAAQRIRLIDALSNSGLSTIEAGSFVSPQRLPKMEDNEAVLPGIGSVYGIRDRKSVVEGKSVSVSVDLGGRCILKKHKN